METAHTHKQTSQFVILQHCLPRKFRSQNMSRYLEGLKRRLWVAQSDPHEWVKVGDWAGCSCSWCSYTICMHNYIYIRQHVYMIIISICIYIYTYIHVSDWNQSQYTICTSVSGLDPTRTDMMSVPQTCPTSLVFSVAPRRSSHLIEVPGPSVSRWSFWDGTTIRWSKIWNMGVNRL